MEINVKSERKLLEIWLTREEKQDATLPEKLKPLYQACKEMGYMAVIFASGEQDLWDTASNLLCCNRRRISRTETPQGAAEV